MAAGEYGYAQAAVTSDNFPADRAAPVRVRRIVLLQFDRAVSFEDVVAAAAPRGSAPTMTGWPRSSGRSRCSTAA